MLWSSKIDVQHWENAVIPDVDELQVGGGYANAALAPFGQVGIKQLIMDIFCHCGIGLVN